ncbi:trihelix transcription factor PTL [Euphorbia lathyris]|uniref:trihelix transcription factor PTL n=1 Tax=Euphorbia lathyris TaxID=212925 RepID=UPI0033137C57
MEMEDHNHHHHHNHNNQYNIDLRHFITGTTRPQHFPPPPPLPVDLFRTHHPQHQQHHHQQQQLPHHYDMMMLMPRAGGAGLHEFHSDSTPSTCIAPAQSPNLNQTTTPTSTTTFLGSASGNSANTALAAGCSTPTLCAMDGGDAGSFGGDGGTGRWPRQETLTLLEIRSRLDLKFKEANQKGPLWDEVSRIMSEEHGYQRSGKKCREKFENLYKYYKKTKEGKAGRQDGKHYRFFRQLEALYGETSNVCSIPESQFIGTGGRFHTGINTSMQANQENFHSHKVCDSLSLSNSSEFDTCSSDDNDLSTATLLENDSSEKIRRKRGKSWKSKIKDFIDSQMRKLIERQETWLEKLTTTLEEKEQERMLREEEWRKQEAARVEKEHKFWAKERAWIEARDATLMDTLRKLTGKEAENQNENENECDNNNNDINNNNIWEESEVSRLMQLRSNLEPRFQQSGSIEEEEALWKDIARKMGCLGYEKNPLMCKEKWDSISNYNRKMMMMMSNKKRKENTNSNSNSSYFYYEQQGNTNHQHQQGNESCFPFLMSDGGGGGGVAGGGDQINLWENYGLKLSKGEDEDGETQ